MSSFDDKKKQIAETYSLWKENPKMLPELASVFGVDIDPNRLEDYFLKSVNMEEYRITLYDAKEDFEYRCQLLNYEQFSKLGVFIDSMFLLRVTRVSETHNKESYYRFSYTNQKSLVYESRTYYKDNRAITLISNFFKLTLTYARIMEDGTVVPLYTHEYNTSLKGPKFGSKETTYTFECGKKKNVPGQTMIRHYRQRDVALEVYENQKTGDTTNRVFTGLCVENLASYRWFPEYVASLKLAFYVTQSMKSLENESGLYFSGPFDGWNDLEIYKNAIAIHVKFFHSSVGLDKLTLPYLVPKTISPSEIDTLISALNETWKDNLFIRRVVFSLIEFKKAILRNTEYAPKGKILSKEIIETNFNQIGATLENDPDALFEYFEREFTRIETIDSHTSDHFKSFHMTPKKPI